jgi:hypothetical protein
LDAGVAQVGYENVAVRADGDARGRPEPAVARAPRASFVEEGTGRRFRLRIFTVNVNKVKGENSSSADAEPLSRRRNW